MLPAPVTAGQGATLEPPFYHVQDILLQLCAIRSAALGHEDRHDPSCEMVVFA